MLRWVASLLEWGGVVVNFWDELNPGDFNSSDEFTAFYERGLDGIGYDPCSDLAVMSVFGGWCPGPLLKFMILF